MFSMKVKLNSEKILKIRKKRKLKSWIVKWYGKYGRKVNHFTIQPTFLRYFPYLLTFQLTFLPYFPYHFTF
jgi:hypothetical protein